MMSRKFALGTALAGAVALGAVIASFSVAQPQAPVENATADQPSSAAGVTKFDAAEQDDIRKVVREYLMEHPEVLIESLSAFRDRQDQLAEMQFIDGARQNMDKLLDAETGFEMAAKPEKATVAVIEFFDYNCGVCKQAAGLVRDLAKDDPSVKVVFRELPIFLSKGSDQIAALALAAREQDKYADYHFALMKAGGTINEARAKSIAEDIGIDVKKLVKDTKSLKVHNSLLETAQIAQAMGVEGTPAFIVTSLKGDYIKVFPGLSRDRLTQAIEEAKKAG